MSNLHSYSSIFTFGHRGMRELFSCPCFAEEKIDGSQFSFGNQDGQLLCRSKGQQIDPLSPPKMFAKAVATAVSLHQKGLLPDGWIFRGECLDKPKHNALAYDRVPEGNVIVYDIEKSAYNFVSHAEKSAYCKTLGLECVPQLWEGNLVDLPKDALLETMSILGGQKIEGFVVKPQSLNVWSDDKKLMIAKVVSESFKEVHAQAWTRGGEFKNHTPKDVLTKLGDQYCTQARWNKAIMHLKEKGLLRGEPQDIALLMREVPEDILAECVEDIKTTLLHWALRDVRKLWTKGLPEYYKQTLADDMLEKVKNG